MGTYLGAHRQRPERASPPVPDRFGLLTMDIIRQKEGETNMRDHPMIEQVERTGYPTYLQQIENDTPVEDMFGDEIQQNDLYFVFKNGDVVLSQNLGHYAIQHLGADELEAE